jgi:sucrose-6-phosphate hydrolase SacC (GH32 family)
MNAYILVVLQTVSIYSSATTQNWQVLGEFKTRQACLNAWSQLVDAEKSSTAWYKPQVFRCLAKDVE